MVSTWMGDHSSVEVDAVVKHTVKSQEWRNGASNKNSWGKKKKKKKRNAYSTSLSSFITPFTQTLNYIGPKEGDSGPNMTAAKVLTVHHWAHLLHHLLNAQLYRAQGWGFWAQYDSCRSAYSTSFSSFIIPFTKRSTIKGPRDSPLLNKC